MSPLLERAKQRTRATPLLDYLMVIAVAMLLAEMAAASL